MSGSGCRPFGEQQFEIGRENRFAVRSDLFCDLLDYSRGIFVLVPDDNLDLGKGPEFVDRVEGDGRLVKTVRFTPFVDLSGLSEPEPGRALSRSPYRIPPRNSVLPGP